MAIRSDSAFVDVSVRYRVIDSTRSQQEIKKIGDQAKQTADAMSRFGRILSQVGQSLIAFRIVNSTIQAFKNLGRELIEVNSLFEKAEIQLKVFTGSALIARDTLNFLAVESTRLAGGLEDLLQASTALETFGIDTKENLELVADIAQATGRAVEDVAIAFGRIVIGDPRTKQFLTTRRGDLVAFNRAIEEGKTRIEAARLAFAKFSGTSEELEGSFARLRENLNDILILVAKFVGEPAFIALRDGLAEIVEQLRGEVFEGKSIKEDNIFTAARDSVQDFVDTLKEAIKEFNRFQNARNNFLGQGSPVPLTFGTGVTSPSSQQEDLDLRQFFFPGQTSGIGINKGKSSLRDVSGLGLVAATNDFIVLTEQRARQAIERFKLLPTVAKETVDLITQRTKELSSGLPVDEDFQESAEFYEDLAKFRLEQEINLDNSLIELKKRVADAEVRATEEALERVNQKRIAAEEERLNKIQFIANNVTSRAGFLLFGGVGANQSIDRQVEKLREELEIIEGVTAPLTRQEQLLNSIVELESQRVNLADRLRVVTVGILSDLTQAAAKAALLTTLNRGRGGFGFFDFLKGALGIASVVPSPVQPIAAVGSIGFNAGSNPFGLGQGDSPFRVNKPIVMNNPVFLSEDLANVTQKASEIADRRVA